MMLQLRILRLVSYHFNVATTYILKIESFTRQSNLPCSTTHWYAWNRSIHPKAYRVVIQKRWIFTILVYTSRCQQIVRRFFLLMGRGPAVLQQHVSTIQRSIPIAGAARVVECMMSGGLLPSQLRTQARLHLLQTTLGEIKSVLDLPIVQILANCCLFQQNGCNGQLPGRMLECRNQKDGIVESLPSG
jgi:hypothetical protein